MGLFFVMGYIQCWWTQSYET